ncbi:MAG: alpha/beta hydrolase [Bacteroidales bacterium]|nr:alpha/beta hydrolase [Bacteroidales bacterium]
MATLIKNYIFLKFLFLSIFLCFNTYSKAQGPQVGPFENSVFVEVDGMQIHYRYWADSLHNDTLPFVLLVHGMGASTYSWRYNIQVLLDAGYKVVAVDVPPYGYSDKNTSFNHTSRNRALLFWRLLERINNHTKWHLVGHSMGGGIVQYMAMLEPLKTESVVFVDPALIGLIENKQRDMDALLKFQPFLKLINAVGEHYLIKPQNVSKLLASAYGITPDMATVQEYHKALTQPETVNGIISSFSNTINEEFIDSIEFKTPAIAIWGSKDRWVPYNMMKPYLKKLPTVTPVIINNAGHCPMETHPTEFNAIILDFLKNGK